MQQSSYWKQLQELSMYSLERRRERYMIIYPLQCYQQQQLLYPTDPIFRGAAIAAALFQPITAGGNQGFHVTYGGEQQQLLQDFMYNSSDSSIYCTNKKIISKIILSSLLVVYKVQYHIRQQKGFKPLCVFKKNLSKSII